MDVLQIRKLTNQLGEDYLNKVKYLNNFEDLIDYWLSDIIGLPTRKKNRAKMGINSYFNLTDVLYGYYHQVDRIVCARYTYTSMETWGHIPSMQKHTSDIFLMKQGETDFLQSIVGKTAHFTLVFIRQLWENSIINVFLESDDIKLSSNVGNLLTKIDPKQYENRVKLLPLGTWEPLPRKIEFYFNLRSKLKEELEKANFHRNHFADLYGHSEEEHVNYLSNPGHLRSDVSIKSDATTHLPWETTKQQKSNLSVKKPQNKVDQDDNS